MKKALFTLFAIGSTAIAAAAPAYSNNFTGAGVEVGVGGSKTDVKNSRLNEKTKTDAAVRASYLTQYGNSNWIGGGEVAVKPVHRKIGDTVAGDAKQRLGASASFIQGYRVDPKVLAYGKVGYHYGKFKAPSDKVNADGVGYGAGVKYALTPKIEVGGEWEQTRLKKDDFKTKSNSYMGTVGYRF